MRLINKFFRFVGGTIISLMLLLFLALVAIVVLTIQLINNIPQ